MRGWWLVSREGDGTAAHLAGAEHAAGVVEHPYTTRFGISDVRAVARYL